jgi:hypothetical protein
LVEKICRRLSPAARTRHRRAAACRLRSRTGHRRMPAPAPLRRRGAARGQCRQGDDRDAATPLCRPWQRRIAACRRGRAAAQIQFQPGRTARLARALDGRGRQRKHHPRPRRRIVADGGAHFAPGKTIRTPSSATASPPPRIRRSPAERISATAQSITIRALSVAIRYCRQPFRTSA